MNKFILKFSLLGLLTIAVTGTPSALRAQSTNAAAAAAKPSKRVVPFHGRLKSIDNTAKTISVGNEIFQVTSETKITKIGQPATLEDGIVGDNVAGSYRKDADGKLNAVSIRFAPTVPVTNTKTNTP